MKNYDSNNIFARILRGELPCEKIYEDDHVLAFNDKFPQAPIHVIVIPKGEYVSFNDFIESEELVLNFFQSIKKIVKFLNLEEDGYRLITNHGKNSGQEIFHFHFHILAGKQLGKIL